MKRNFTIILFLMCYLNAFSQVEIAFDALDFHSNFEKKVFQNTQEQVDFGVLFSINPTITTSEVQEYEAILTDFYAFLERRKIGKKKPKRAIKNILWHIRKRFLKEYDEYAHFDELFKTGKFNCVTASIIYALTLERFDISYEIRELPTHVYIVVAPKTDKIILETTDSLGSLYAINQANFVRKLAQAKLISEIDLQLNSVTTLYYKYMSNEEQIIDIRDLAGDLYYNESIRKLEAKSYLEALQLIDKSLYLHPREHAEYVKASAELELANQANIQDYKSLKYLFALLKYEAYQAPTQNNIRYFNHQITKKYLIDNYNKAEYWKRHHYLLSQIDRSEYAALYDSIQVLHFKQMDYSNYIRGVFDTLHCLDSAYQIASDDVYIQNSILNDVKSIVETTLVFDRKKQLETYIQQYPFLEKRDEINSFKLYLTASEIEVIFDNYQFEEGFVRLKQFEEVIRQSKASQKGKSEAIGIVYSSIYNAYLDKMDSSNAQKWIEKGLQKAPKSQRLLEAKAKYNEYKSLNIQSSN